MSEAGDGITEAQARDLPPGDGGGRNAPRRRFSAGKIAVVMCVIFSFSLYAYAPVWWKENRGHKICVADFILRGVWGDKGPGLDAHLRALTESSYAPSREWFLMYHTAYGKCVPVSREKFWHWVRKTADELDWAVSQDMLATRYGYGDFFDKQYRRKPALPLFGRPAFHAEADPPPDDIGDGLDLDLPRGFALLKKAAAGGDSGAQSSLSKAYYRGYWGKADGLTVGVDYKESTKWLEKAAENAGGSYWPYDAYFAGRRYRYAEEYGLRPDYGKAYKYFSDAAGSYVFEAMLELALMHNDGIGVEQSAAEAMQWLEKAAERLEQLSGMISQLEAGGVYSNPPSDAAEYRGKLRRARARLDAVRRQIAAAR